MLLSIISLICYFKLSIMGDDRTHMSNNKTPLDDIIEHITADLQSYDGQYILLGQPSNTSNHTIWHQYNNPQSDVPNYVSNTVNYETGCTKVGIDPNVMYTQNTFVDMSNGSFVPYIMNSASQFANPHDPHMSYLYCQQHSSPPASTEYGLFNSNNLESRDPSILQNLRAKWVSISADESFANSFNNTNSEPMEVDISPQYYNHEQNFQQQQPSSIQQPQQALIQQQQQALIQQQQIQPQLLHQELQQQHSPFKHHQQPSVFQQQPAVFQQQPSVFQQQQSSPLNQHSSPINSFNTTPKKTRMVAEVRPMRPTYSDVLAKSVSSTSSTAIVNGTLTKSLSGTKAELGTRSINALKQKKACSTVKSGNVLLHRQHSSGSEEQVLNGFKSNNDKKARCANETNQWPSIEDLEKHSICADNNDSLCNAKSMCSSPSNAFTNKETKKSARKAKTSTRQKDRGGVYVSNGLKSVDEDRTVNNKKNAKKFSPINASNFHWGVGKTIPLMKNDKKSNKTITVEGSSDNGPSTPKGGNSSSSSSSSSSSAENTVCTKTTVNNKSHGRNTVSIPLVPKKTPRILKRRESPSQIGLFWNRWSKKSEEYALLFVNWFANLLWDVIALSFQLSFHMLGLTMTCCFTWFRTGKSIARRIYTNPRNWWREFKHCNSSHEKRGKNRQEPPAYSIPTNIPLPSTGDEAMKRLLACKGKDAYSILGVMKTCSDDVIKRYYKRQAVLVHPDKNNQPGAEEAFKILIHAFELIGEPEKRKAYDRCIMETHQMDKVWGEFSSLLVQLHKKMEYAANTIRCTNCGQRHRRIRIERPLYAARFCSQCKIRHSSREGDIWAESLFMGWLWKYYACMDGSVYDISDWANCQSENLRHLKPNMHVVQYRIVVGKNRQSSYPPPPASNYSEPDLDDFLSSLYGHSSGNVGNSGNCTTNTGGGGGGDLHNRIRKKSKKKSK